MKMVFKKERNVKNQYDNSTVEVTLDDVETLDDILEGFEEFLRGCGFIIKGNLDVVNEDE